MIKLIKIFQEDSLYDILVNNLDLSDGSHNIISFDDLGLRGKICEVFLDYFGSIDIFIIGGFNLRPYLNLIDNIYSILNIDLSFNEKESLELENYCDILGFDKIYVDFYKLSSLDKLKSMIIVSLLSNRRIILFDSMYLSSFIDNIKSFLDKIDFSRLFNNRVFIEFKKQVTL